MAVQSVWKAVKKFISRYLCFSLTGATTGGRHRILPHMLLTIACGFEKYEEKIQRKAILSKADYAM